MIGIDTNVLVRFLAQDEPHQARLATRFMERLSRDEPGYISSVVLAELSWVLARAYGAPREQVAAAIGGLLRSAELVVENAEAAHRALAAFTQSPQAEFADALIAETAALAGARETATFDRRAARALGMRLLS